VSTIIGRKDHSVVIPWVTGVLEIQETLACEIFEVLTDYVVKNAADIIRSSIDSYIESSQKKAVEDVPVEDQIS
jgi:hypothetical protein